MTGAHNIGSVAGVMGVTRSEFEALKESVNELKLLVKELSSRRLGELGECPNDLKQCITKFLNVQTPKINIPTSLRIQETDGNVTSLNVDDSSFTIIVDHPHVETTPMQANVSADQPHVDSTQKAADFTEIEDSLFTEIEDLQEKSQVEEAIPHDPAIIQSQCVGDAAASNCHYAPPYPIPPMTTPHSMTCDFPVAYPAQAPLQTSSVTPSSLMPLNFTTNLASQQYILPTVAFLFAILLVRPFDRGKCWLRDAQSYQARGRACCPGGV